MKTKLCQALTASIITIYFAMVCVVSQAQVTIPTSSDAGPISSGFGIGLLGSYYGVPNEQSDATTDSYIAGHNALATFVSTSLAYPSKGATMTDTHTLTQFLGSDASSLSNPSVGSNNLTGQLMSFTGYLAISAPGTYKFELGSDDGSRLDIGGIVVDDNPGSHNYATVTNSATFSQAGLYPVDLIYYEMSGSAGITLTSNLTGTDNTVIPDSLLDRGLSTPEPGTCALATSVVLAGASFLRRKRVR